MSKRERIIWIVVFAVGLLLAVPILIVGFVADSNLLVGIGSIVLGGLGFSVGARVLWLGARPPRDPTETK